MWFVIGAVATYVAALALAGLLRRVLLPEWAVLAVAGAALCIFMLYIHAEHDAYGTAWAQNSVLSGAAFIAPYVAAVAIWGMGEKIFSHIENRFGTLADAVKDEEQ